MNTTTLVVIIAIGTVLFDIGTVIRLEGIHDQLNDHIEDDTQQLTRITDALGTVTAYLKAYRASGNGLNSEAYSQVMNNIRQLQRDVQLLQEGQQSWKEEVAKVTCAHVENAVIDTEETGDDSERD